MIYLNLFLTFLKIGAVSFGGGYGMIALVREEVLGNGWLTEEEFLSFIAVSESTPGPLAVNMATFIGSSQAGFLGALTATAGVVLPAFVIILLIAAVLKNLVKYRGVQAVLGGIRPATAGLVTATALILFMDSILPCSDGTVTFNIENAAVLAIISAVAVIYKMWRKKNISPILLIVLSAGLGVMIYTL